jgi:hypothetical protein
MLVHTKKPLTKTKNHVTKRSSKKKKSDSIMILVSCPTLSAGNIKQYLEKHGCVCVDDSDELVDAKGLFAERTPANMLIGARGKENITQMRLSELTGIPRRHISDMENGRRPIGKQNAVKLGKALNISYRLFF